MTNTEYNQELLDLFPVGCVTRCNDSCTAPIKIHVRKHYLQNGKHKIKTTVMLTNGVEREDIWKADYFYRHVAQPVMCDL